jgi:hypothetical protein
MINRPALCLLLVGCVVFGMLIFIELAPGGEDAALPEAAQRVNVAPVARRQQAPLAAGLLETALARPLFSSTRRPPQSETEDGAPDTDLSDKRLTGIVTEPGHHIAIFAVDGAKPLTLSEGENVSGWRIETIGPIEVSLSGPSGSKTLRPKPDPNLAWQPGTMPAIAGGPLPTTPAQRPTVAPRR